MRFWVVAFASGIWWCQQQAVLPPLLPLLAYAIVLGLGCALAWRWRASKLMQVVACLLMFACGVVWAAWRAEMRLAETLPAAMEGGDFVVSGYIADLPDRGERGTRFLFRAEQRPAGVPENISLSWYADGKQAVPPLRAGEAWQLTVRLRRPHGNLNPHGFDFEGWMFERDIRAVGYVRSREVNQRKEVIAYGIAAHIQHARQVVRERFERALPQGRWVGVLSALAVGDQSAVSAQQWRLFSQTGVTHLMSISGGHVTLFAALIAWLVRRAWSRFPRLCLRLPAQKAAIVAGALAAFFYVLLSGFGVPAQRTLYMLLVAAAGIWFGRGTGAVRCLSAALLVVLLYDPWAVLSPGFWLSFGAVAVLFWVGRELVNSENSVLSWLRTQLRAQWAIIVLTLPILLGLFQQFSLVSPFANALAIPLISAVITPLALLFAVLPLPSLAELAHWLLDLLMRFLEWLALLPMASWQQAAPPGWLIVLGVCAAFWALLPRGVPGRRVVLLVFLPLLMWTPLRPAVGRFDATIIDVGQGLSVHVQTARHDLLFDTGPQYTPESDSGERVIHPFLRAAGVQQLDRMVVSHDDLDHSGGAASLLKLLPVRSFMSSLPEEHVLVRQAGGQQPCARGDRWDWDGVSFEVLHPAAEVQAVKDNNRSCVLRVSNANWSLLLAADIEAPAENELLANNAARLRSTVMVAPHHGSKTSSQPSFVDAVAARTVIFTTGYRNRFHHPAPEIVARYAATGANLLRSDTHGAVILEETAQGEPQPVWERQLRARYWQGK
ncbi:DNA internalization-related competence protein ComEC/Rec2 [Uliginosibacterium sp. H3]|uniref:DNA internalization-related competence protein ComEC/Rec2 n=1 Tax=Uliginosibacterium silvisoli TaxID=3114758 RepID=A0ABU6K7S7_9RHOO|nr:DNA internalization-related competence protein ComEC/Rec2 [Uliginosibacterium sp. H3]